MSKDRRAYNAAWYRAHAEETKSKEREFRLNNPEATAAENAQRRQQYAAKPVKLTEEQRLKRNAGSRRWAAAHKEKTHAFAKRWRENNSEHAKARARAYYQKRRSEMLVKASKYRAQHIEEVLAKHKVWYAKNRDKVSVHRKAKYEADPHLTTKESLKRNYGLTVEDYDRMLAEQGSGCAICRTTTPAGRSRHGRPPRFHVDHDHVTSEIRGLLCHGCNVGIGSMKDNPDVLMAAADYLVRTKARKTA